MAGMFNMLKAKVGLGRSTEADSMEVDPVPPAVNNPAVNDPSAAKVTKAVEAMEEDGPPPTFKLKGAKIGENIIANVTVETEGPKKIKTDDRVAILILDCSGSMGHWVQRSVTSWQRALRAQNYKEDDEVHMIEFESWTTMTHHKLSNLDGLGMRCRGGTSMSGVVEKLLEMVMKYKDKTINVWVISDGGIGDQHQFKEAFTENMAGYMNSPNINVVGVRLCSGYSDPDIQAMSAVGLLSTQEFGLENYQMNDSGAGAPDDLVEVLSGMKSPEEKVTLTIKEGELIVRPGEKGEKALDLWNQDWFIITGGSTDSVIEVCGVEVPIEFYPETENLSVLEIYATKIYLRLVQEKVAGLYDNMKFIEALEQLFFDLDNMSKKVEVEQEVNQTEMSTTSRALQIKKKFVKQQQTLRQKIAYLKNLGNMENMSGHMKSDLMRGLGAGKGDMGLMRRYARTDQGKDPSQMMTEAIAKCKPALLELKGEKDQAVREECFFSKESSLESALVAIETSVSIPEESEITPDTLLTIFGLHGLAIKHKAGNYTDPMLIGLNQGLKDTIFEVYTNVVLNQSILWYAKQNKTEIKAPGFDGVITAVVPIKSWNHPAVWKLYCQDTDIAAMQTSAHLRNVLTPLPKDRVAFTASLLLKMMGDWADPSEIQRKMMSEVLLTIQWKTQSDKSKEIADKLKGDDPLAELSTTNNLASELAPFAQILCDPTLLEFLAGPDSQKLWRALVANTVYWTVRRALGEEERGEVIKKLMNYNKDNFTHPLPDNMPEPENLAIHDIWDEKKAGEYIKKHKYLYDNKLYTNMMRLSLAFKAAGNKTSPDTFKVASVRNTVAVGMDLDLFCQAEVVKSILTKNETERYGENSIGFHATELEARNYLAGVVRSHYRRQYDNELKLKEERVKEKKLKVFLDTFVLMSFVDFALHLQENIPNQGSKGKGEMLQKLEEEKDKVVALSSKAELLLIGKLGEDTWNNGSVSRNSSPALLRLLEPIIPAEKFAELKEHVDKYAWHRYRDCPNRQGNSNTEPSFWAATNYVDPWSYLKNDKVGYRQFLKTLETLDGGEPSQQAIFDTWSHLLTTDPHKHDVTAGKQLVTGKEKRKMRKKETDKMHAERKRAKTEGGGA